MRRAEGVVASRNLSGASYQMRTSLLLDSRSSNLTVGSVSARRSCACPAKRHHLQVGSNLGQNWSPCRPNDESTRDRERERRWKVKSACVPSVTLCGSLITVARHKWHTFTAGRTTCVLNSNNEPVQDLIVWHSFAGQRSATTASPTFYRFRPHEPANENES